MSAHSNFNYNSPTLETNQVSFNGKMVKQILVCEFYGMLSAIKKNKLLTQAIKKINCLQLLLFGWISRTLCLVKKANLFRSHAI